MQSRHSKLYCLCSRDIQKLYCLCSRDIQNFIVCAVATFKTLLFVQSRHSKLYCLCSRDIQNFIVCAVETFETLLFVQSQHSKLYCLCSRAIRNFLVCVSLLGLRSNVRTWSIKLRPPCYIDIHRAETSSVPCRLLSILVSTRPRCGLQFAFLGVWCEANVAIPRAPHRPGQKGKETTWAGLKYDFSRTRPNVQGLK